MDKVRAPVSHTALVSGLGPQAPIPSQNPAEAAKQFEALLVQEMLKSMWQTVPKGELISGSNEEQTYRDMFTEQLSQRISEGKGLGIKEVIQRDIEKLDKKA